MPLPILGLLAEELAGDVVGDSIFQDKGTPESRAIEDPDSSEFIDRVKLAAMLKNRGIKGKKTRKVKLPPTPDHDLLPSIPSVEDVDRVASQGSNMDKAIKTAMPELDGLAVDEIGDRLANMSAEEAKEIDEVVKKADPDSVIGKALSEADRLAKNFGYKKSALALIAAGVVFSFINQEPPPEPLPPEPLPELKLNELDTQEVEDDIMSLDEEAKADLKMFLKSMGREGAEGLNKRLKNR